MKVRARRESLDESTALHQLLGLGARAYGMELYQTGQMTLREASEMAGVTLREMLDLLWAHGVRGNITAPEEDEAFENLVRVVRGR